MKTKSKEISEPKNPIPKVLKPTTPSADTVKTQLQKIVHNNLIDACFGVTVLRGGKRTKTAVKKTANHEPTNQEPKAANDCQNDVEAAGTSRDEGKVQKRQKAPPLEIPKRSTQQGTVFVIGENDVGQLGLQNVARQKYLAEMPLGVPIVDIAAGGMHSVCLSATGEVYTFGCNDEGSLGRPQTDDDSEILPEVVELPEEMVMISSDDSHTASLSVTGKVYLWGNFRNSGGSMGLTPDGKKQTRPLRILKDVKIVKIASGAEHLACLSSNGEVYTCGCAECGQLGRVSQRSAGDGGRTGGIKLLLNPGIVRVPGRRKFDNIWTGSYCTFLRERRSQNIYAFGLNNYHQLGFNNGPNHEEITRFAPKRVSTFPEGTQIISGGQHHTLALNSSGHVYAIGRNDYGTLGLGMTCNDVSELTQIPYLQNEKCCEIGCGSSVSFAVNVKGHVYSWGMGNTYQLGHENEEDCCVPKLIEGKLDSWHVLKAAGGGQHTLILAYKKDQ